MIGAMSGTSMDGLDLVLCEFQVKPGNQYSYKILQSHTYSYPPPLLKQLRQSKNESAMELYALDKSLGNYFADCVLEFLKESETNKATITAIASHGHTIFHQPERGFTVQIGCGITIAERTGIRVINDFRQKDIVAGGQGAPLVPLGDEVLFQGRAQAFLNIGGFCNMTIPGKKTRAFDICPGNLPLNQAANSVGELFDAGGTLARSGMLIPDILSELNALPFYKQAPPKSLGTEWLETYFTPILEQIDDVNDRLHTIVVHIADQIARACRQFDIQSLFITGGGAFNDFLLDQLRLRNIQIVLPSREEINFKEALIFAFLGVRYLEGKPNCLASVTGANRDVCGGNMHLP